MTDKKQEFLDFFSAAYDAVSEGMEVDGLTICWVANNKTLVHWHFTGDTAQHVRAYVSMAGLMMLERATND